MSDFFTKKNNGVEFGPGPSETVMWMIVDPVNENLTKVCYVRAKTAFQALQEASKYMEDISNKAVCYPNTVRYPSDY